MSDWNWDSNWPAPAKLNLFLHAVGRREDGYHLLQTVFRFIDRADTLRFEPRSDGQIVLATPIPGVPPDTDLTVRAARLLQQAAACRQGATIHLDKQLPMGGGLGGGSSDAATVLLALNHLWQTGLSRSALEKLGLSLGADVPVFIHGRNTFAEGVGEAFTDVELPAETYLILHPAVHVPTAAIFGAPELKRDTAPIQPTDWQHGQGHNDLEPVACAKFPAVAEHLAWLKQYAPQAMMTGSGACVFAGFKTRRDAAAILAQCPAGMNGWIADGLAEHPLAKIR
ncbi:4-(cytidine 5'-diphospho)-2-C-methyl-D-erythritol kinase [Ferribacterium limneticum]|uniref:4-(cytidine 5'-diphospho)-2-C-methyl-D-erythritol kinase n=1 Tax=Ferribacterium limneticum TaxID=76259 RepID=UPI001CF94952|nr:4-(cytidine 5'-diphospho)-2-C-methyl-D-erythritol kinase [Ferribacterium limneticum]UCV28058.1 4-(cytidine 5'-diphospho)-2-C-methyl-D-erythritol kinase [Ferribacterium limneticum]UCV31975.1 4-(cytidine 5'-diphospho)-2-C-methyl-D-erythritol kinase [Ferribacterium limneticum]